MIEVDSVLFMGLLELVLLLLAVDVVIIVRSVIRRRRENASIERLVTLVKRNAERREKETRNLLEKKYNYSDDALEKATKKIIREEKRMYQVLANLFTTRDNIAIENLSITFEEAVEPYRLLDVPQPVADSDAEIDKGGDEESNEEIKRLNALVDTLNEELGVTMNTIGRMLHEYSTTASETNVEEMDQDDDIVPVGTDQKLEDTAQTVAKNSEPDAPVSSNVVSQKEDESAIDELLEEAAAEDDSLDSVALVGMFQEDDASAEESVEASPVEDMLSKFELEDDAVESKSAEESLAQEIDDVLENNVADLSDVKLTEMGAKPADAAASLTENLVSQEKDKSEEIDPTEALTAQTTDEAEEDQETPLPEIKEETLEDEVVTSDSVDDLLEQAINQTIESHETALPDMPKEEVVEDPDAEKQLVDEIAETLSNHSETMSSDDIDSLLQGTIGDTAEK